MRVIRWKNAATGVESLTITATGIYFPVGKTDSSFIARYSMDSAGKTASIERVSSPLGDRIGSPSINVSGTTEVVSTDRRGLSSGIAVTAISGTLNAILDDNTPITNWPDDSLGRFPAKEDLDAYVYGATPPTGLLATAGGVQVRWDGSAWEAAGGGTGSPASPTAIGGVYSKTTPVPVSTLAAILATTPTVGTVGLPSDSPGSQMEYGPLGWDGYFGLYSGGMPAVRALPTTNIAFGARIKCARAGFNIFSWQGTTAGWILGEVGDTQLVAQGPPQLFISSSAGPGTEVVADKTHKAQSTAIVKSWDAIRAVVVNRSNNSTIQINKAMAIVSKDAGGFNSTTNTRTLLKFKGNFGTGPIPKATQADNEFAEIATFIASDLTPFPQETTTANRAIELRMYHDPASGNNKNSLIMAQDNQLGAYTYSNASGDSITTFTAMSGIAGYYCPMYIPVFYKFQNAIPASAIVFGDSIARGQTTTLEWRSLVNVALRSLEIPYMQMACFGQSSEGTLAVMQNILPFLASIKALPTHAIIWAYSPNDRLKNGSNGAVGSYSWNIFVQKLALLKKYGVEPVCIGPVPDAGLATLKALGDLLVSDYGGYSPFMDNSTDGLTWIAANTNDNLHPNDTSVAASIAAGFQAWLAGKIV